MQLPIPRDPGQTQIWGRGAGSSEHPAFQMHTARLPASSGRPGGGGRDQAHAHLAVALPADLLAAAVGAGANGVQHLVVLHPSRHGRAHAGRLQAIVSSELQPRRSAALICSPGLTVAGPDLAAYWLAVRPLRLSNWLRRTQHAGHLGKKVSLGNRVGVCVDYCQPQGERGGAKAQGGLGTESCSEWAVPATLCLLR